MSIFLRSLLSVVAIAWVAQYRWQSSATTNNKHSVQHEPASHLENCSFDLQGASGFDLRRTNTSSCVIAKVILLRDDMRTAVSFLHEVSSHAFVHKMVIESVGMEAHQFGMLVDEFITVANWWVIKKEIYNHRRLEGEVGASGHAVMHLIVLHRFHSLFEAKLRHLSAIQYPPTQAICEETPLTLLRMINSGWGSQMGMFSMWLSQVPYSVTNIWYSMNNWANESMQTCHHDDCGLYPGVINKWECMFLPLTTCNLDHTEFIKCHNPTFDFDHRPSCWLGDATQIKNMSATGGPLIAGSLQLGKTPMNDYQKEVDKKFRDSTKGHSQQIPSGKFINAVGDLVPRPVDSTQSLSNFGLMYRPNYNLRSRIQIALRELQDSNHIPFALNNYNSHHSPSQSHSAAGLTAGHVVVAAVSAADEKPPPICVAVHIRRGDRNPLMPISMTEYCDIVKEAGITRNTCTDAQMHNIKFPPHVPVWGCGFLFNFGCWETLPFGALTLVDFLLKGQEIVPTASAAFVMTDDGPWLESQIAALPSTNTSVAHWKVGMLPANGPEARSDKNGTKYTLDFFASVAAARECSGFVGHWGSGVSQFVYSAMCFHHEDHTGQCPPAVDIGGAAIKRKPTARNRHSKSLA